MTELQTTAEAPQKSSKQFWHPVPTMLLTVLVYLGSQLFAAAVLLTLPMLFGISTEEIKQWLEKSAGQFLFILLVEGSVLLLLWGLLHVKKAHFRYIGLMWPKLIDVVYAFLGFGIYFLLYLILALVAKWLFPGINFDQQQHVGFETAKHGTELVLVFFSLVVMPPVVEEILARGFLYSGLKTKYPVWLAGFITCLMFAAAHLQFGSGAPLLWVAAIDTFTLSVVLVYLREKTGRLGASIILHMLKNSLAFFLLFVIQVR